MSDQIRIGSRGSKLALYQAELVQSLLMQKHPDLRTSIVVIKTSGDEGVATQVANPMETKRVFTREIEEALYEHKIDAAVHSAKDMAVPMPEGLNMAAVLDREDVRDCFLSEKFSSLHEMPKGSVVGTSSVRRQRQLLLINPEITVKDIHGNVDTRIAKMRSGEVDAIILALAGVKRLNREGEVTQALEAADMLPAPGQGAIVVQAREEDVATNSYVHALNNQAEETRLLCERAFLKALQGGCQLPCGIITQLDGSNLKAKGLLLDLQSSNFVHQEIIGDSADAETVGTNLAYQILANGGQEILEKIQRHSD